MAAFWNEFFKNCSKSLPCALGRSAHGRFFQTTASRNQTNTHFHQTDVRFECRNTALSVQHQFATAAQGDPGHRSDHRHIGVFQRHEGVLQFLDARIERFWRRPA